MATKNDVTGDSLVSKAVSDQYRENYPFKDGPVQRGGWIYVDGKLVPKSEVVRKPRPKGPMIVVKGFAAYESPSTGNVISTDQQRDYDLKESGCREWEGMATENQETARHLAHEDKKFEETISEGVERTFHELKSGQTTPENTIDTGWLADE